MKRIDQAIRRYAPTFRNGRTRFECNRIAADESFEKRIDRLVIRRSIDDVRVELAGLAAEAHVERERTNAGTDSGLPAAATRANDTQGESDRRATSAKRHGDEGEVLNPQRGG